MKNEEVRGGQDRPRERLRPQQAMTVLALTWAVPQCLVSHDRGPGGGPGLLPHLSMVASARPRHLALSGSQEQVHRGTVLRLTTRRTF